MADEIDNEQLLDQLEELNEDETAPIQAWDLNLIVSPKSAQSTGTAEKTDSDFLYWYVLNKDLQNELGKDALPTWGTQSMPYALFVDSTINPENDLNIEACRFIPWGDFQWYRRDFDFKRIPPGSKVSQKDLGNQKLYHVLDYQGKKDNEFEWNKKPRLTSATKVMKWFDDAWNYSQKKAIGFLKSGSTKLSGWSVQNPYQDPETGTSGIAFLLPVKQVTTAGGLASKYVKVSTATRGKGFNPYALELQRINIGQQNADDVSWRGLYIAQEHMDELSNGTYDWDDRGGVLPVRGSNGIARFWSIKDQKAQAQDFWQDLYKTSLRNRLGKPVRSRNVVLDLLFVVDTDLRRISEPDLTKLKDNVTKAASQERQIKQTARVIEKKDQSQKVYAGYDYMLSVSPFGDYETWISSTNYVSFLEAYPPYSLPDKSDQQEVEKLFEGFQDKGTFVRSINFANAIKRNQDYIKQALLGDRPEGVALVAPVTLQTIGQAGVRGARDTVPTQYTQLGGSATDVAKTLKWDNPGQTLVSKKSTEGPTWDSPGVYPAEWLHRSAFSWGSEHNLTFSSVVQNFIFGTSEANSLMTRYEKSWQRLFSLEGKIAKAVAQKTKKQPEKLPSVRGMLRTVNTDRDSTIKSVDVKDNKLVFTELERDTEGNVTGKMFDLKHESQGSPDKDRLLDYWDWTEKNQRMSANLAYWLTFNDQADSDDKIWLTRILGYSITTLATDFYPFQRGFFTRLEADLDLALLDYWAEKAITKQIEKKLESPVKKPPSDLAIRSLDVPSESANAVSVSPLAHMIFEKSTTTASTASLLPHAELWQDVVSGNPISIGGVAVHKLGLISEHESGATVKLHVANDAVELARQDNMIHAAVISPPQTSRSEVPPLAHINRAVKSIAMTTPAILAKTDPISVPEGFTLTGEVKLFGLFNEQLYSFHGPNVRQIVVVEPGEVKISQYMPSLAGSAADGVQLENIQFVYNELSSPSQQAGTWLQADVLFSGYFQPVSDILSSVFQQQHPMLRLSALLSPENDWSKPIQPRTLTLSGSIPNMNIKVGDMLKISELGLGVDILRRRDNFPPFNDFIDVGFAFNGLLQLTTPGDAAPLNMDFVLDESQGWATLSMICTDDTRNLFGVSGAHLSELSLTTSFDIKAPSASMVFMATASMNLSFITADLSGFYSKGDWSFCGELQGLTFDDVREVYEELFDSPLFMSNHDIVIDDLGLVIGSDGMTFHGKVTIEGYTSAEAKISISNAGVEISGEVDDVTIEKDVLLEKAAFDVFIGKQGNTTLEGPGTSFRFAITGEILVAGLDVTASLTLDKTAGTNLVWTLYGEFKGGLSTGKIAEPLKNSFLDFHLDSACVIASNVDQTQASSAIVPAQFPVVKGLQIAATIDSLPILDKAMNNTGGPTTGLTLQAMYDMDTSSFQLKINLAVAQKMSMKSSVSSGNVSLMLTATPSPALTIYSDFYVQVAGQDQPLQFNGGLTVTVDEARLFIEMATEYWTNPLGLSPLVKLGPHCALQVGIVFGGPVYPSEIGVSGGLVVGSKSGKAALSISESPSDELVMMEIDDLGVRDLVDLASLIFQEDIPRPEDFLHFEKLALYLSSGTTIGTTFYPPGASFTCDALIFGKEASIYVGVDKRQKTIAVKGSLDPIEIGPLVISGLTPGTKATIDLTLGSTTQHILIDGEIRIGKLEAMANVKADLLPTPTFDVNTKLAFSTHLDFELQATMRSGSLTSLSNLKGLDFDVHVLFQQDILDYISAQINSQIIIAKHAVDDGIETAEANVRQAKEKFEAALSMANSDLEKARTDYQTKLQQARASLEDARKKADIDIKRLDQAVSNAKANLDQAISQAEGDLRAAREQAAQRINEARQDVQNARANGTAQVDEHLRDLHTAQRDMQARFGSALKKIDDAQARVDSINNDIREAQGEVDDAQRDYDHANALQWIGAAATLAAKKTKLAGIRAGLDIANAGLTAAKDVVNGPGYIGAKALVDGYGQAVQDAKVAADASLAAANAALSQTQTSIQTAVDTAASTLDSVKTSGQQALDLAGSKNALEAYRAASDALISGLESAVTAVGQSAEKAAFDTAQAAVAVAKANTKDVDIANAALEVAKHSGDAVLDAGNWILQSGTDILNVRKAEASGDLRGLCEQGTALQLSINGTFVGQNVDFSVDFMPGDGEETVKRIFEKLIADLKGGSLKISDLQ